MSHAFFITGTDTDAGKTTIACGLLAKAKQMQLTTAAIKPVASGSQKTAQGLRNSDALALSEQCYINLSYQEVNPFCFENAIAPHIAAQEAGVRITVAQLQQSIQAVLSKQADMTIIESAGGWRVPLNETEFIADVALALQLPIILVVGIKLGCISHAILTKEAIIADGLTPIAWVANCIDPCTQKLSDNLQTLQHQLRLPCLGVVPYLQNTSAETIANYLTIEALLSSKEK